MIVSILQRAGLAFAKSIQSRPVTNAEPGPEDKTSSIGNRHPARPPDNRVLPEQHQPARTRLKDVSASPLRRQEVKAQTAKPKAQPAAQVPADSPKKAVEKKSAASKSESSAALQPASPASARPLPVKPEVQPEVKPMKAAPASKSAATAKRSGASPAAPAVPATKTGLLATAPAVTKPVAPVAPVAKAGRPSRLSQITVPSMAQTVASTAAKASYTNAMPTPVLTHPPFAPVKKDPKLANNWKTKTVDQLTDAEVLAMSDDEYMNDKQMAFFRLKLSQLKQDILSNAGETTEHLREDTAVVPDPADRATIEEEHALELRTRDRERKLLKKIEQSIIRIDAGDYGYCDETGEPIGVGRLLARPTATLSLEAQQRRELKQKMFGD